MIEEEWKTEIETSPSNELVSDVVTEFVICVCFQYFPQDGVERKFGEFIWISS